MTVANPQHVTARGYIFKVQREAIVRKPYPDGVFRRGPRAGERKYSQGVGSQTNWRTFPPSEVKPDDPPIDIAEAIRWLRLSVAARELDINRALKVIIKPHEFDATESLYYQAGSAAMKAVTGFFNEGFAWKAIAEFWNYRTADGIISEGITKRRIREMIMGIDGNYGDQSVYPFFDGDLTAPRQMRPTSELGLL